MTLKAGSLFSGIGSFDAGFAAAGILTVWLGVSVEDQARAAERIPLLLQTTAAVRFLSCEPLLGPLDLRQWLGICVGCQTCGFAGGHVIGPPRLDWVIVGGESGPGARLMALAWARSIVEQCQAAGVRSARVP